MSAPYTYQPSSLPQFDRDERVEDYMDKLLPWLRDEFEALHRHLQQGPVIERNLEAPRAPFDGMIRLFSGGWTPSAASSGWFVFSEPDSAWFRFTMTGGYPHT